MKIISNRLYEEYTKDVIGFHQYIPNITKKQLYDIFKFHCANLRVLNETVEYYSNLQEENKQLKEKIQNAIWLIKDTCIEQIPDMPKGCYRETASIGDLEELLEILESE